MADYASRMSALLDRTTADVVALVPGANMIYFTGLHFHLSERPTIAFLSREGLSIVIPQLEMGKLAARPDLEAHALPWSDGEGYRGSIQQAVAALKLDQKRLGVDGMTMRVFEWLALASAGMDVSTAEHVGQLLLWQRSIKTAAEVDAIRRAIALSEEALHATLRQVGPGMSEQQIATLLSDELSAAGSQSYAFSPLVLTGPRSALPHGMPGARSLGADEYLLIDFGGKTDDYPADITRTYCLGTPSDEMRIIHDAVLRANTAARELAGPGVTCGAVDKAARDVIEAAGYGEYFTHRTGHGLGLEGHELPNIAPGDETVLEPGMVFTIEPGIYIPEIGGVRIEDVVHITASG
ncbi:MAG: M24 family metallopeptidase, partial [Phototrophicaceae bacterium]